jgi:hypothetical protein
MKAISYKRNPLKKPPYKPYTGRRKIVEILHVDTVGSRAMYQRHGLNSDEKSRIAGLMKVKFKEDVETFGGKVISWVGDGGFAFFPSQNNCGSSIKAARSFLQKGIPLVLGQIARAFHKNDFQWSVRIKIHRGECTITKDPSTISGEPKDFDDFIKKEKRFAPEPDHLFITAELYNVLTSQQKGEFVLFKTVKADSIKTAIYRLKASPKRQAKNIIKDIIKDGKPISPLTQSELQYLTTQIIKSKYNVAARNEITKGLIKFFMTGKPRLKNMPQTLLDLTLDSLYNYLRVMCEDYKYRISYWRASSRGEGETLTMVAHKYPVGEKPSNPNRSIPVDRQEYKLCRCYRHVECVATPDVVGERRAKTWIDFHKSQSGSKRHLSSALQLPVYYREDGARIMQGVLCIDTNKPDTFLPTEVHNWKDDLVGFLVNISLSEAIESRSLT